MEKRKGGREQKKGSIVSSGKEVNLDEWAWQHPVESRAVRQAAASFKTLGGVANKIKLAYTMLTLPEWQSLNLTVNFFSTKYKMHSAGCPSLPEHMRVQVCALEELPCYTEIEYTTNDSEEYEGSSEELTDRRSAGSNTCFSNQDSTADEHIDWREEHAEENSTPVREDSYIIIDSPVKTSSSIQSGSADNKERYKLDDEFGGKLGQQSVIRCQPRMLVKLRLLMFLLLQQEKKTFNYLS